MKTIISYLSSEDKTDLYCDIDGKLIGNFLMESEKNRESMGKEKSGSMKANLSEATNINLEAANSLLPMLESLKLNIYYNIKQRYNAFKSVQGAFYYKKIDDI